MARLLVASLLALVLAAAAFLLLRGGDELHVPPTLGALTTAIDREAPRLLERERVPGAAVAVVWHGRVAWSAGYGLAPDTVFQVASVSKPVSALGILTVAARRRIDLDAPIAAYLHDWTLPASRYDARGVTLRRLLSHTAGLSVPGYPGHPPGRPLPSTIASLDGDAAGAGPVRLVARPGARFSYSGGGFLVAQALVEDVTRRPFAALLHDTLLAPVGMRASSYGGHPTTSGHDAGGRPLPDYRVELAPGGLVSTAPDLARFLAAVIGNGPIARAVVAEALRPAPATGGDYGLGFELGSDPRMVSHIGADRGWRSLIAAFPQARLGLVVLTNGDNGDAVAQGLLHLLVH